MKNTEANEVSTWNEDAAWWKEQKYEGEYDGRWTHDEQNSNCTCDSCNWIG